MLLQRLYSRLPRAAPMLSPSRDVQCMRVHPRLLVIPFNTGGCAVAVLKVTSVLALWRVYTTRAAGVAHVELPDTPGAIACACVAEECLECTLPGPRYMAVRKTSARNAVLVQRKVVALSRPAHSSNARATSTRILSRCEIWDVGTPGTPRRSDLHADNHHCAALATDASGIPHVPVSRS